MKTFHFHTRLGSGLTLVAGTASFYGVTEEKPVDLGSQPVDSADFATDLDSDAYNYFYTVLRIESYDAGSGRAPVDGRNIMLLSVFKSEDKNVCIGERETIANTFCFSRFASIDSQLVVSIAASDRDMGIMYGMRDNFISARGTLSEVIRRAPNGRETNSYSMFNYLSNLLYYCVSDPETYNGFTGLSTSEAASSGTFQSFLHMTSHPWNKVQDIYDLISDKTQIYTPSLPDMYTAKQRQIWNPAPNQWTLTVKVNDSGAQNFLIAGPGYIAFDKNDRAWLTNNVTQGSPNSASNCVVLNADGSPAPFSPVFGGGLLGGGFGVTANAAGSRIFFGNFGWGPKQYNPETGSISVISCDGATLSPSNGYTQATSRVQGLIFDGQGNLWITSWGTQNPMAPVPNTIYDFPDKNSAIVVYLNYDGKKAPKPEQVLTYEFRTRRDKKPSPFHCPFDVAIDSQGHAFVANAGATEDDTPSSVYKLRLNFDNPDKPYIECMASWTASGYEGFRQINVNSKDEVFVASFVKKSVLKFDNDLTDPPRCVNHNIGGPWGITFDKDDTMYVANFFPIGDEPPAEGELDARGVYCVTVIQDDDPKTAKIMTLPTGGAPVTLANGFGVYGSGMPPSYQPLTRLTGTGVDRVGNLWALNNWKPSAMVDFGHPFEPNPAGDGVVIFIGAARPNPRA